MKRINKIVAVLLAVTLLTGVIPVCLAPAVSAADVGTIVNGGFETNDGNKQFSGWTSYEWSTSVSTTKKSGSYSAKIGKDSSLAGHVALEQIVPVNTNATYTFSYYAKRNYEIGGSASFNVTIQLGSSSTSFSSTVVSASQPSLSTSWSQTTHTITTGSYKYARIRFNARGAGTDSYVDDVAMTATVVGDASTHNKPTLLTFGTEANRPIASSDNKVVQPGFESTASAPWSSIVDGGKVTLTTNEAYADNQSLYINNQTATGAFYTFAVPVEANVTHVLSAWLKTPYLSAANKGKTSIGIIDPTTNEFAFLTTAAYKDKTSSGTMALRPTATDDEWHLRGYEFNPGNSSTVTIGIYAAPYSQLYIDDISVHKAERGTKFVGERQTVTVTKNKEDINNNTNNVVNKYCASADNLIADCNMNSSISEEFWSQASSGWRNGYMSITDGGDGHGRVMKYTGKSTKYSFFKWITVEPNVSYTISFDYKVTTAGSGKIKLVDNNIKLPVEFASISFSSSKIGDWQTYAIEIDTTVHSQIGFVIYDGGGAAMVDDIRVFKTYDENGDRNGLANEPTEEILASLKPVNTGTSTTDPETVNPAVGNGLAFLVEMPATGFSINEGYKLDYTNAVADVFGTGELYKIVTDYTYNILDGKTGGNKDITIRGMGAIMCNNANGSSTSHMVLENVNNTNTLVINADKGITAADGKVEFAVRIINIPETHVKTTIYMRPYYIFEYNRERVVVYGDIAQRCYKQAPNVNDGQLDWN